jgi:hypothetical protein
MLEVALINFGLSKQLYYDPYGGTYMKVRMFFQKQFQPIVCGILPTKELHCNSIVVIAR